MFFKEEVNEELLDTLIPNTFFEQLLPIMEPKYLRIYLYAYYLCQKDTSYTWNNQLLADKLGISIDEVLEAWDFFELCKLIEKHRPQGAEVWDFSVEFKNLKRMYTSRDKTTASLEKNLMISQNEEYQKMYDKIESILGSLVMSHHRRAVNEMITAYNLPKDLVVEAFRFGVQKKGFYSVQKVLSILRIWYTEGVRTVEDLEQFLLAKGDRYGLYKKILSFLGEYRMPTKAEEELMDKWLDDYKFSMEVIEEAFAKSIGIKSPNMKYIDGILRNWHEKTLDLNLQKEKNREQKDPTLFRLNILEGFGLERKNLTSEEQEQLRFLYEHFSMEEILMTMEYIKKLNMEKSIVNLYRLMKNPELDDSKKPIVNQQTQSIQKEEIQNLLTEKRKTKDEIREEELEQEMKLFYQKKGKKLR
jgi:dnaD and phage-associated domain-containing protein